MSEWDQMKAWTEGRFDGIVRRHHSGPNGAVFTAVCARCGEDVWWSLPTPEDLCFSCGETISDAGLIAAACLPQAMQRAQRRAESCSRQPTLGVELRPQVTGLMEGEGEGPPARTQEHDGKPEPLATPCHDNAEGER